MCSSRNIYQMFVLQINLWTQLFSSAAKLFSSLLTIIVLYHLVLHCCHFNVENNNIPPAQNSKLFCLLFISGCSLQCSEHIFQLNNSAISGEQRVGCLWHRNYLQFAETKTLNENLQISKKKILVSDKEYGVMLINEALLSYQEPLNLILMRKLCWSCWWKIILRGLSNFIQILSC